MSCTSASHVNVILVFSIAVIIKQLSSKCGIPSTVSDTQLDDVIKCPSDSASNVQVMLPERGVDRCFAMISLIQTFINHFHYYGNRKTMLHYIPIVV